MNQTEEDMLEDVATQLVLLIRKAYLSGYGAGHSEHLCPHDSDQCRHMAIKRWLVSVEHDKAVELYELTKEDTFIDD